MQSPNSGSLSLLPGKKRPDRISSWRSLDDETLDACIELGIPAVSRLKEILGRVEIAAKEGSRTLDGVSSYSVLSIGS